MRTSSNQSGLADFVLDKEINTSMFVQENGGTYDLLAIACVEDTDIALSRYSIYLKFKDKWLRLSK